MNEETADQIAWVELAEAVRGQLRKVAELMPAMKPEEIKTFVDTCSEAHWLHVNAMTFDREVELKRARLFYSDLA